LQSIAVIQSGPEKFAQNLMHRDFATVCSRIEQFSPKCSEINW